MNDFIEVCSFDDLPQNVAKKVMLDGVAVAVVKDSNDVVHALGDTCTHGDISLSEGFVEGETLECWAHGSAFSLKTGKPLNLPAYEPVPVFETLVKDNSIFVNVNIRKEV